MCMPGSDPLLRRAANNLIAVKRDLAGAEAKGDTDRVKLLEALLECGGDIWTNADAGRVRADPLGTRKTLSGVFRSAIFKVCLPSAGRGRHQYLSIVRALRRLMRRSFLQWRNGT